MTRSLYERLKHINVLPPNRLKAGLFSVLEAQGLRRDVVASVSRFLSVPDLLAVTDYCSTLPRLMCRKLANDRRLKVLDPPVDLGRFPIHMAWHVRYRNDPAHEWVRGRVVDAVAHLHEAGTAGTGT